METPWSSERGNKIKKKSHRADDELHNHFTTAESKRETTNVVEKSPRFSGMCYFIERTVRMIVRHVTSSAHSLTNAPEKTPGAFLPQLHCRLLVNTILLHVPTLGANTHANAGTMRSNIL